MVEKLGFFCRYIDMFHYMYNNMKRRQGSRGPSVRRLYHNTTEQIVVAPKLKSGKAINLYHHTVLQLHPPTE